MADIETRIEDAVIKQQEAAKKKKEEASLLEKGPQPKTETKTVEEKKKVEEKKEEKPVSERLLVVPIRKIYKKPRTKRGRVAISFLKSFVSRHMKSKEVKISNKLNRQVFAHGMKNPPGKLRVKAKKFASGLVSVDSEA